MATTRVCGVNNIDKKGCNDTAMLSLQSHIVESGPRKMTVMKIHWDHTFDEPCSKKNYKKIHPS